MENGQEDLKQQGGGASGTPQDPDYKALYEEAIANSRKWETRSKENYEKAQKLDEIMAGKKSVEDRIAELEASNKKLETEKQHAALVKSVAAKTGVPESIISALSGEDEDALTTQAKAIAEAYKTPGGAPAASEAGKFPKQTPKKKNEEELEFVRALFANQGRN